MSELTHIDKQGKAKMVDVGNKSESQRSATARGEIAMAAATLKLIAEGGHSKGDVISVARVAGIQAAKNCSQLIPLCHPLMLTSVAVELELDSKNSRVLVEATCKVNGPTGVEMEALTAVSVTALTIYDMCKAVDKEMTIGDITLIEKQGGKSGHYRKAG
ncbi:MAG: cyclic pyranopterin monophosphate synthase MoaC [Gammaproteobacteria bacterium]|nr:cyclic pyranopterin monophosphate synthase MoaC [Gammaproteobacteria bacterium]MDD9895962.1 cyclic pyranopterin monophosphate synthase MoaC [Gammaproteobacteria bacterium]